MDFTHPLRFTLSKDASIPQEPGQPFRELPGVLRFAFPNDVYAPVQLPELAPVLFVPPLVLRQLGFPILKPGFWNMRVDAAGMLVPKATPNVNDPPQPWEHDIRFSGKVGDVKPITIAHAMNQSSYYHFR